MLGAISTYNEQNNIIYGYSDVNYRKFYYGDTSHGDSNCIDTTTEKGSNYM